MIVEAEERSILIEGNVRLVDRTREGVALQVARGVVREESPNEHFARHVARKPWSPLTEVEREALLDPRDGRAAAEVYALDFPAAILDRFWDDDIGRIVNAASDDERRAVIAEFREYVLDALAHSSLLSVLSTRTFDLAFCPGGSHSTSFDARSGRFVGLHLDDHENLPFDDRARGFQLLTINLGQVERYFQFINHDVASLLSLIGGVPALLETPVSAAWLVQRVFAELPDCPVVRMTLKPGQGYVAITQNMIHDGATNAAGRPDINVLLGGRFDLGGRLGKQPHLKPARTEIDRRIPPDPQRAGRITDLQ